MAYREKIKKRTRTQTQRFHTGCSRKPFTAAMDATQHPSARTVSNSWDVHTAEPWLVKGAPHVPTARVPRGAVHGGKHRTERCAQYAIREKDNAHTCTLAVAGPVVPKCGPIGPEGPWDLIGDPRDQHYFQNNPATLVASFTPFLL